jgi:hypothetical protein
MVNKFVFNSHILSLTVILNRLLPGEHSRNRGDAQARPPVHLYCLELPAPNPQAVAR